MLLERRSIEEWSQSPEKLVSAHLYTDASPVSGVELQAMIISFIFTSGVMITKALPGVTMPPGRCRAVDKAIALFWSLFLICASLEVGM